MKILTYANQQRLLIEDGKIYLLTHEKPEGEFTIFRYSYPDGGGWGSDNGKTIVYFKKHLPVSYFKLVKASELANGETVEFRKDGYRHGDHIADMCYYQFAFVDGRCIGWCESDPWSRPDEDFGSWQSSVMARRNVVPQLA